MNETAYRILRLQDDHARRLPLLTSLRDLHKRVRNLQGHKLFFDVPYGTTGFWFWKRTKCVRATAHIENFGFSLEYSEFWSGLNWFQLLTNYSPHLKYLDNCEARMVDPLLLGLKEEVERTLNALESSDE